MNKFRRALEFDHKVHRGVVVALALILGVSCAGLFVIRSYLVQGRDQAIEVVAISEEDPESVVAVVAGEPLVVALERRLDRELSRERGAGFEGLAADAAALLSTMANGRLEPLWAMYEAAGGEMDRSLAAEYRDFLRTFPEHRRPEGWEMWSDHEALLRANQPRMRAWSSVTLRRLRVVLPEDVESPSSAWPPLDQRAHGRASPLWSFPMFGALLESGAPIVGVDVEYIIDGQGRFVSRFWFVRVGERSWFHAMTDTLERPPLADRQRLF